MPRKYSRENGEEGPQEGAVEKIRASGRESHFGRNILVLLLVVGALFLFNGFGAIASLLPQQQLPSAESISASLAPKQSLPQGVASFGENYADRMIAYRDKYYGFEISYPVGYYSVFAPELGVRLRFQADYPGFASEVVEVLVSNETDAKTAYESNVADFSASELQAKQEIDFGWRKAYLISARQASAFDNETVFLIREGFFSCTTQAGEPYSVAVVAAIPQEFEQDTLLASYMIRTFKC
ncbi:MAG: hypothetical protein WC792_01280 [Candidatus Micrarchaeia archaeon]|jgi:hypothetical protein